MAGKFGLLFNLEPFKELDQFALLCDQEYNFGDRDDWFSCFRSGYFGFISRTVGVQQSYRSAHAVRPLSSNSTRSIDADLGNLFFNMDSCIECLVFALNAVGYGTIGMGFRNVSDERELARIAPKDVVGNANANPLVNPLSGFTAVFPSLVQYWQSKMTLLTIVIDQHDVSKHRRTIYLGGQGGFEDSDGALTVSDPVSPDRFMVLLHRMKEIHLEPNPKIPRSKKPPFTHADMLHLEQLVPTFVKIINKTGQLALADARQNIHPNHTEFLRDQ